MMPRQRSPMSRKEWERLVLRYDPFAGDKDDGGYRVLRDQVVTARASGSCAECGESIVPGTRIRLMVAVGDGRAASARSCHECCEAMVQWMLENEQPLIDRINLRRAEV